VIRAARPADYLKLADIERRAGELFREVGMPEIADAEPADNDDLAAALALFIATDEDDEPIGFAMVELVDDHAHLAEVCVVPEHGGQGVGTQLLDAVADWAKGQGHDAVTLTTFRDVPFNAPLYAKRGYEVVPEADWTDDLCAVVAREADHGLDTTKRVVMRRTL
jgi:GNAT superfamily N-acetyltransferase